MTKLVRSYEIIERSSTAQGFPTLEDVGLKAREVPNAPEFTGAGVRRALWDGLRLHCPACHEGKMFSSYFTMRAVCARCGVRYEREQGEYIMAMYVNLLIAEALFVGGYFLSDYLFDLGMWTQFAIWAPFNLLFVVLFYPRSKGLWAACLYLLGNLYEDPSLN
jgi:uncharacterized protein (DUF983 family)